MLIGSTFSHVHLEKQHLLATEALRQYADLSLPWIRLGCYWHEIEPKPGQYDFSSLDRLVDQCGELNLKIVMTVGMKAPRFPEYYFPGWLDARAVLRKSRTINLKHAGIVDPVYELVSQCVSHYQPFPQIKYWQVENEPFDPSGPDNLAISTEVVKQEVRLVRQLDQKRPIVINLWGNELTRRGLYHQAAELADIVGFDFYTQVPQSGFWKRRMRLVGPADGDDRLRKIFSAMRDRGKQVWISELQAEPWTYAGSCTPERLGANYNWAADLEPDALFLWGYEYWYEQKQHGNSRYWEAVQRNVSGG